MNFKPLIGSLLLLPFAASALNIYPQVSSTIVSMANTGTSVKKGDIIVQLDDRQAQLELQSLKVIKSIKQQTFDDRLLEFNQAQELYDRLSASHRDVEIAKLAFDAAKRQLDAHQILIQIKKIELEKYQIKSPMDASVEETPNLRNTTNVANPKILMVLTPK